MSTRTTSPKRSRKTECISVKGSVKKGRGAGLSRVPTRCLSVDNDAIEVQTDELDGKSVMELIRSCPGLENKVKLIANANRWTFGETVFRLLRSSLELNETIPCGSPRNAKARG